MYFLQNQNKWHPNLTEVCHHLALVEILAGAAPPQAQRTQLLELRCGGGGAGRARRLLLPRARRQAPGPPLRAAAGATAHGVRPRGQAEPAPVEKSGNEHDIIDIIKDDIYKQPLIGPLK